jgi:hypothetical protein
VVVAIVVLIFSVLARKVTAQRSMLAALAKEIREAKPPAPALVAARGVAAATQTTEKRKKDESTTAQLQQRLEEEVLARLALEKVCSARGGRGCC